MKPKLIAFYLPQYHPIGENDRWWGKGFSEWINVGKAKKLFRNHYQPKIPGELGYYDLRVPETRIEQAKLAKEAGVDAFCYWHYYFGNGKRLLEKPLEEVIKTNSPNFPFCLAWANHSWYNKTWTQNKKSELLIEQKYPGLNNIDTHFYTMLHAFKDDRYYRIDDKLVFVLYRALEIPDFSIFVERWQNLAKKNGLPGFYFIGHTYHTHEIQLLKKLNLDAINVALHHEPFNKKKTYLEKFINKFRIYILRRPDVVAYSKAIKKMSSDIFYEEKIYPTLIPNWDHTPRSGYNGRVMKNSTPLLFSKHVDDIFGFLKNKGKTNQVVFIKSWNEWGEGNYLEPDLKFGKGYLNILAETLNKYVNK